MAFAGSFTRILYVVDFISSLLYVLNVYPYSDSLVSLRKTLGFQSFSVFLFVKRA